jgi:hypothetical protein
MKLKIFIVLAAIITTFSSCNKDYATDWVGTYTGVSGSTFNRIVVSKVNNNTIKMEFQQLALGAYYTFATVANGSVNKSSNVTISEDGNIYSFADVYHFSGGGSLNGNTLTINGQAQSKTNASDVKLYTFTGSK